MFIGKTSKDDSFAMRANVVSSLVSSLKWEFVMGALSRYLPRRFSLAGHPSVATAQHYSTARFYTTAFQSQSFGSGYSEGLFQNSRARLVNPRNMRPILKLGVIVLALIILGGSSSSPLSGATASFSNQEIQSYIQLVTNKLEQPGNHGVQLGTFNQAKLSCYPVLLGQGERAGNPGLYTWFTCSGIHKAVLASTNKKNFSCTGFSSAVWIQPAGKSVTFAAVTNDSQYLALKSSAPTAIQIKLTTAYSLVHQGTYNEEAGPTSLGLQNESQPVCS
jgi:hypothetical protein